MIGQQVGDYQIMADLGEGGMGMVYRGQHLALGQIVAIKSLHATLMNNQAAKDRFIREAQALARLNHPNIIGLKNFINNAQGCFIIMEFAEGETLEDMLQRMGIIPPDKCIPWFIEACRGLTYAHQQNIIHRDIKPSNIIVHPTGTTKLLDFGTAKLVDAQRLTQQGMTLGTVIYMSKEQLLGKTLDARSDVYSLGVTLYESVTGQLPFFDEEERKLVVKIAKEEPIPPSQHYPGISRDLEQVILKAMAKDPAYRYQSATEMEGALATLVQSSVTGSTAQPAPAAVQPVPAQPPAPARPLAPTPPQPAAPAAAPQAGSALLSPLFLGGGFLAILGIGVGLPMAIAGSGVVRIIGLVVALLFTLGGAFLALVAFLGSGSKAVGTPSSPAMPAAPPPSGGAGEARCPNCGRALLQGMSECPFCQPQAATPSQPPPMAMPAPQPAMPTPPLAMPTPPPAMPAPPPAMPTPPPAMPAPPPAMPAPPPAAPAPQPVMPMGLGGTLSVNSAQAAQKYGAAAPTSVQAQAGGALVQIIDGNDRGKRYQIGPNDRFTLGRASTCSAPLNDAGVSSEHCALLFHANQLYVQDLNSRNGVFVNNQKVNQQQVVSTGDLVVLGSTRLLVNIS